MECLSVCHANFNDLDKETPRLPTEDLEALWNPIKVVESYQDAIKAISNPRCSAMQHWQTRNRTAVSHPFCLFGEAIGHEASD